MFMALLLGLAVFFSPVPTHAATDLKVATMVPDGTFLLEKLRDAAKEIQEKTGGDVRLKIYAGGVMGDDGVVLSKIRIGQLHGGIFSSGSLKDFSGDFQLLAMPMLLRTFAEVDTTRARFEPVLLKRLEDNGFISMGMIESGFVYLMSKKPVAKPADLQGTKVWTPEGDPISRAIFEELSIPPVPIGIPDVLTGLQTGIIDTVTSSPVAAIALQWFTKVDYLTEFPILYHYGTMGFPAQGWKRIPEKHRPIVKEILVRVSKEADARDRKDNESALNTLRERGIQFVEAAPNAVTDMEEIARRATEHFRGDKLFDMDLLDQIRATVKAERK